METPNGKKSLRSFILSAIQAMRWHQCVCILDPSMPIETPSDQPNGDDVEERGHILDGKY